MPWSHDETENLRSQVELNMRIQATLDLRPRVTAARSPGMLLADTAQKRHEHNSCLPGWLRLWA